MQEIRDIKIPILNLDKQEELIKEFLGGKSIDDLEKEYLKSNY
jgi:hypothetical protein